jgi:methylated-DNA-[protein]-cysteine S-methyltransferase
MTRIASATLQTPLGPLTLIGGDEGLIAAGFTASIDDLRPGLGPSNGALATVADLGPISRAAARYFEGDLDAIDEVPVRQPGSDFQQAAWRQMRRVPAGRTITYQDLAGRSGTGSARAAGSACARNAVALFVPCHRIVQSGGGLGGYYWGLDRKRWLLEHERALDHTLPLSGVLGGLHSVQRQG